MLSAPEGWLIVLPFAWAACAIASAPAWRAWIAIAGISLQLALALELARQVLDGGARLHRVGGWGAPLGIDLLVDGLAAVMLVLAAVVALAMALYTRVWLAASRSDAPWLWPVLGALLAGLDLLFLTRDLFNPYVGLELVGLSAVALVAAEGKSEQIEAAWRYLLASLVAAGAWLLGIALLYGAYGTVSFSVLAAAMADELPLAAALGLLIMALALLVKGALFPFHYWLPPAHGSAATPVSALLSALVVKAPFYLLLRLRLTLPEAVAATFDPVAATLGTVAIVYGSWQAFRAERLKLLVAYSTVAQLGYVFLIFPLLGAGPTALAASVIQVVAHALAKASLFAAAGVAMLAMKGDAIADLESLAGYLPRTWFAFGFAGVTLMGLPPSGGFLAKWLLIEAATTTGNWPLIAAVIAGGLLAALYVFRILARAYTPERGPAPPVVPQTLEWIAFGLAVAAFLVGIEAGVIAALLARTAPA